MSDHKFEICICGHAEHEHDFSIVHLNSIRLGCQNCACNEWEFIGSLDYLEWEEYKRKNEIDMFITSIEK